MGIIMVSSYYMGNAGFASSTVLATVYTCRLQSFGNRGYNFSTMRGEARFSSLRPLRP